MMNTNLLIILIFLICSKVYIIDGTFSCDQEDCKEVEIKNVAPTLIVTASKPVITIKGVLKSITKEEMKNFKIAITVDRAKCEVLKWNQTITCLFYAPIKPITSNLKLEVKSTKFHFIRESKEKIEVVNIFIQSTKQILGDNYLEIFIKGKNFRAGSKRSLYIGADPCSVIDTWRSTLIQCYHDRLSHIDVTGIILEFDHRQFFLGPIELYKINKTETMLKHEEKMFTLVPLTLEMSTAKRRTRPTVITTTQPYVPEYLRIVFHMAQKRDNTKDMFYLIGAICLTFGILGTLVMLILFIFEIQTKIEIDVPEEGV